MEALPLMVKGIIIAVFSLIRHAVKSNDGGKVRLHASAQLRNVSRATRQRQKLLRSALFKGQDLLTLEDGNETSEWNYHSKLRNIPEERRSNQHRGGSLNCWSQHKKYPGVPDAATLPFLATLKCVILT